LILKDIIALPNFDAKAKKPYGSSTLASIEKFVHKVIHRIWGWIFWCNDAPIWCMACLDVIIANACFLSSDKKRI
jgi:hypothetical protein